MTGALRLDAVFASPLGRLGIVIQAGALSRVAFLPRDHGLIRPVEPLATLVVERLRAFFDDPCADLDMARAKAKAAEFNIPRACTVDDLLVYRFADRMNRAGPGWAGETAGSGPPARARAKPRGREASAPPTPGRARSAAVLAFWAACSGSSITPRRRISRTSGCTDCSTVARSRQASSPPTATGWWRRRGWGTSPASSGRSRSAG